THPAMATALLLLVAGCAAQPPAPACPAGQAPALELSAFFGRGVPGGGREIDDAAWARFRAAALTPRFPRGSTETDTRGTWRGREGRTILERSLVLTLLVPEAERKDALARLQAAAAEYRHAFSHEAVGIAIRPACTLGFF
ncbi:MAG: DUF3574 domain-containing protein, partial [Acetobacteraceae bacterium]|nr:DUF3574 domain-containing protein [Acetobacteraceae bacterium]